MSRKVLTSSSTGADLIDVVNNNDTELYSKSALGGINVKDYGVTGDGITDDTNAIVSAMALVPNGGILYFPNGTYMINIASGGWVVDKPLTIVLEKYAELKAITASTPGSAIIHVTNGEFFEFYGGKVTGDFDTHIGVGETNHLFDITDSSNIRIHDTVLSKASGDCIAVHRSSGTSENIIIERVEFTDYRRWGVFCDINKNLVIRDCNFHDIYSDLVYGGAIDCEYHGSSEGNVIEHILIENCDFTNIGDDTHSNNGGLVVNANAHGAISGVNLINNRYDNCNFVAILAGAINFNIERNEIKNAANGVTIRGTLDYRSTMGSIRSNVFTGSSGIFLGYGNSGGYDTELVKGLIIDSNRFNDLTGYGISARYINLQKSLIINNVFHNSQSNFDLPALYCSDLVVSNNLDTANGLITYS